MNKSNLFSLDEAIGASWQIFKKSPLKIIGFLLLLALAAIVNGFIFPYMLSGLNGDFGSALIVQVESWIFGALLQVVSLTYVLNLLGDKKTPLITRATDVMLILKVIAGTILTAIIFILGFILLIIPGIIFVIRLQFVPYFIVDKGAGPVEAVKKSWAATRGSFFSLLGLSLVLLLINLFGLILLAVGLLVTVPLTYIVIGWVYKKLSKSNS